MLILAVGLGVSISFWLLNQPNPTPDNARYIHSTIPETVGTIFVITVAVMQMLGNVDLKQFVRRPEFLIVSITTLISIVASLIILYRDSFCYWTAICLGWSVANFISIGWFIVRVVQAQDIKGITQPKQKPGLESMSISELKTTAIKAINNNVPSAAVTIINQLKQQAIEELNKGEEGKPTARDICRVIKDLEKSGGASFHEILIVTVDALFEIDGEARRLKECSFSIENSLIWLNVIGVKYLGSYPEIWERVREYTFEIFKKDIEANQINTKNIEKKKQPDSLDIIMALVEHVKDREEKRKLRGKIQNTLTSLRDNPKYDSTVLLAYCFRLIGVTIEYPTYFDPKFLRELIAVTNFFAKTSGDSTLNFLDKSRKRLFLINNTEYKPIAIINNTAYKSSGSPGPIHDIYSRLVQMLRT